VVVHFASVSHWKSIYSTLWYLTTQNHDCSEQLNTVAVEVECQIQITQESAIAG